jgi:MoxR-like ATPase
MANRRAAGTHRCPFRETVVNKEEFEAAVRAAIAAPARSGTKWRPLERLFGASGLRGSGALNNTPAERITRIRQLFTKRVHPGFDRRALSQHVLLVLGSQTVGEQVSAAAYDRADPEQQVRKYVRDLQNERPAAAPGEGTRSALVLRHDQDGALTPRVLLIWDDDAVTAWYRAWYPGIRVEAIADRAEPEPAPPDDAEEKDTRDELEGIPLVGLDDTFHMAAAALKAGKHVILYGPPGTGKTELAAYLCQTLIEDGVEHYDFATATSDWSTFDTIGGYLPDPTMQGLLDFRSGIVTRALEKGRWLIIDEINRADVDKAFGELFTLLTGQDVKLPFKKFVNEELLDVVLGSSNEPGTYSVKLQENWRLIGTMNTSDKASLYQLSYAFMRRFAFVEVPIPGPADYSSIIQGAVETELGDQEFVAACGGADGASFIREYAAKVLPAIFLPRRDEEAPRRRLDVGPAIPMDVISYIRAAWPLVREEDQQSRRQRASIVVLQGLEMMLYPQFEGRNRDHRALLDRVAAALELDEPTRRWTGERLAIWTGHELT